MNNWIKIIVMSVVLGFATLANAQNHFDEIRDNENNIRPEYTDHFANWQKLSQKERQKYLEDSRAAFLGDVTATGSGVLEE